MRSYFFIPASKLSNFESIENLGVNEIIIDFEDAILSSEKESFFLILKDALTKYRNCWLRIPLHELEKLNLEFIKKFVNAGYTKFVLPKLRSQVEVEEVLSKLLEDNSKIETILLVEEPKLLIQLRDLMKSNFAGSISGIGVGSHDLLNSLKAEHNATETFFPRMEILYVAKGYEKISIDLASMNIGDKEGFDIEVDEGIRSGYDAKFLIHPIQNTWLMNNEKVQQDRINWARKIIDALPKDYDDNDMEPFVLDGNVIEKPHIKKAEEILKKNNYGK